MGRRRERVVLKELTQEIAVRTIQDGHGEINVLDGIRGQILSKLCSK